MFERIEDIKLQNLKDNHIRLYYFGLGFIQLKINETYRLHFYSARLPAITEDIHNHRYNFQSKILKGNIINRIWCVSYDAPTNHIMLNESCNPNIAAPKTTTPCSVHLYEEASYSAGDIYHMDDSIFHQVQANNCITLLKRGPYTKEFAQIVLPENKESVCPFSKEVDQKILWEVIEEMLSDN